MIQEGKLGKPVYARAQLSCWYPPSPKAWRQDPALLRAYSLASWVWVAQYLVRIAVFTPLWAAGAVVGLGVARVALSWPLVAACLAVSGAVLVRVLPADHPGLRSVRRS